MNKKNQAIVGEINKNYIGNNHPLSNPNS